MRPTSARSDCPSAFPGRPTRAQVRLESLTYGKLQASLRQAILVTLATQHTTPTSGAPRMSHEHKHSDQDHHGSTPPRKRPIHHKWWFWVAVLLMLIAMIVYVMTMSEAIGPGGTGQPVPAAP